MNRIDKLLFYSRNVLRDLTPQALFRARLQPLLATAARFDADYLAGRVAYYNKLAVDQRSAPSQGVTIDAMPLKNTFYYYDLRETARYFPRSFRMNYEFGDVTYVPPTPTLVKSRPIAGENRNSVLMKLDKLRHFYFYRDSLPFDRKRPLAVWRGNVKLNSKRLALVRRWHGHRRCDIGHSGGRPGHEHTEFRSPFMSPVDQMAFKYIVSVEGNDVATNLKWVMASNSLCLMPTPIYETWFMEGRLEAGKHYVPLQPDFSDLEDQVLYYESHPAEAVEIVRNAQAHVHEFLNEKRERLISLLVLYRYFALTGQIEPAASLRGLLAI